MLPAVLLQAKANVEVLRQTEVIKNVQNILQTNVSGVRGGVNPWCLVGEMSGKLNHVSWVFV